MFTQVHDTDFGWCVQKMYSAQFRMNISGGARSTLTGNKGEEYEAAWEADGDGWDGRVQLRAQRIHKLLARGPVSACPTTTFHQVGVDISEQMEPGKLPSLFKLCPPAGSWPPLLLSHRLSHVRKLQCPPQALPGREQPAGQYAENLGCCP